jgi:hypothetical protein
MAHLARTSTSWPEAVFALFLNGVEAMKAGRPRAKVDEELILCLRAKGWGYRRIARVLSDMGGYVSAGTIRNIITASSNVGKTGASAKSEG